jgi:hypothetical protein
MGDAGDHEGDRIIMIPRVRLPEPIEPLRNNDRHSPAPVAFVVVALIAAIVVVLAAATGLRP